MDNFLEIGSFIVGVLGLGTGIWQFQNSRKVKKLMQAQYTVLFNRLKNRMLSRKTIKAYIEENQLKDNTNLVDYLWTNYQGISDLYVSMVGFYLNNENKFTYSDLKSLVDNKFVTSHWQEVVWRNLIISRKENRSTKVPDFFLDDGYIAEDNANPNHKTKGN